MSDGYDGPAEHGQAGYRLHKLEVSNWGTFDSLGGGVHSARPSGATALLVGQNGCGKSTLVDALLTLLVRPVVRNYNVAAGAQKQERDERTYVKGAYGRAGRDDDNRADVRYLRPDAKHYSVILACFRNEAGDAFTLAQVLHVNGDNQTEKVYCFADGERSIAGDLARLAVERMRQQVERRGFRATPNYTEYFGWLQRRTGIRPKAMDVFNQTVAVKDIQSLNRFIREHMLEPSRWHEKVNALQAHFRELSEAHQCLVRVRRQHVLLVPVADAGRAYAAKAEDLARADRLAQACDSFFRHLTVVLLEPDCALRREELVAREEQRRQVEARSREAADEVRRLRNEIENAGGARLREIPLLVEQHRIHASQKRAAHGRLRAALNGLGLDAAVEDDASFAAARAAVPRLTADLGQLRDAGQQELQDLLLGRADANRRAEEVGRELQSLGQRQGNLPDWSVEVRRQVCADLRLPERDLPFVAELVAVRPEERAWEASIEMVLRGFAMSLLVPQRHYQVVSAYVDRHRLRDAGGRGQRLVYLRVGQPPDAAHRPPSGPQSLVNKLRYQEGHLLLPWVRATLAERFDLLCCESIQEFQASAGSAVTRERHVKWRGHRHEKDDREHASQASRFVLGWDNGEKRRHVAALNERIAAVARRSALAAEVGRVAGFDEVDFARHEREIDALQAERRSLEERSEAVRVLKGRLAAAEAQDAALQRSRDELREAEYELKRRIGEAETLISNARGVLQARDADGSLAEHRRSFAEFEERFREAPLAPGDLIPRETGMLRDLRADVDRWRAELQPLQAALCAAMVRYLKEFDDDQADLSGTPDYLNSFLALLGRIEQDDLPRHEQRFKERLNEKVTHEIGLLYGSFQSERAEVRTKVDLLNQCLRQLEYRAGTYMRLEPRDVRDPEIVGFQEALRACLDHAFEGTPEADEARYVRIERLLARLREEERWRDKVTDVRRWFDFAARELDVATGAERGYYQDSAGQSGGEKAKLAFTILVAAIAYQYDLDPTRPRADRFQFVVVDEMFSKVDDQHAEYALNLFRQFGLQLLIVAPLDAKARVTEPYVGCYLHAVKDSVTSHSRVFGMTAEEFGGFVRSPAGEPAASSAG